MRALLARARSLAVALRRRERVEAEMDEEMRFHLDCRTEDLVRAGLAPAEARRRARLEFGPMESLKEARREARGLRLVDELAGDARYALRAFRRSPALAAVVVATLAAVIGLGGLGFALVDALLLRPLPLPDPDRLVVIHTSDYGGSPWGGSSYADLVEFRAALQGVADLAAESRVEAGLALGEGVAPVVGALTSPGYFAALGLAPRAGRWPAADAAAPAVVLSERLWRERLGGDERVLGRPVRLNGHFYTVAAVAPARFGGVTLDAKDFWVAAAAARGLAGEGGALRDRGDRRFQVMARLRGGATVGQARARLEVVAARLGRSDPASWRDYRDRVRRVSVLPEPEARRAGLGMSTVGVMAAVALAALGLVAAACINLVSAQLARAAGRTREMGIRLALGAGRGRILRQLLVESALLAAAGAALGVALVPLASRAVVGLVPGERPNLELSLGWRLVALGAAGAGVAVLVFGLAPALHTLRGPLRPSLSGDPRRGPLGGAQGALIVGQIALCLALGGGAVMLGISLLNDGGAAALDARRVLTVSLSAAPSGLDSATAAARTRALAERLGTLPGVAGVTESWIVPRTGARLTVTVGPAGVPEHELPPLDVNVVGADFFRVMRVRLAAGREFSPADRHGAPPVAVVSRSLAERLWPGRSPLGRRVRSGLSPVPAEVVGVVPDRPLTGGARVRPMLFLPAAQHHTPNPHLHLRTRVPAGRMIGPVLDALRGTAPELPVREVVPLDRAIRRARVAERAIGRVAGALALIQLLLALAGLSAVVRLYVARRTPEIGVRLALGARSGDVLRLVAGHGARLAGAGLAAGLLLALGVWRLVAAAVPDAAPAGPAGILVATAALLGCTALALFLPARRALAIPPASALRHDG